MIETLTNLSPALPFILILIVLFFFGALNSIKKATEKTNTLLLEVLTELKASNASDSNNK